MNIFFQGRYFKCQSENHSCAFIPAVHREGGIFSASLQIITDDKAWNIPMEYQRFLPSANGAEALMDKSYFGTKGIRLSVNTREVYARGRLYFTGLSPLNYDIMGPFKFFPLMECRHSVISMRHAVNGKITINGKNYIFKNDPGYIEADRGTSFPRRYAWTQCFFPGGSIMISVADVPLGPVTITGVIAVIQSGKLEKRIATYFGAKAVKISDGEIVIRQGDTTLTARLLEKNAHGLHAPVKGKMSRIIKESISTKVFYRCEKAGKTILQFTSPKASFEYEY